MRVLIAVFLASAALWADVTGTITGVVSDPSGAVVPHAEIVAINTGTNAQFRSASDEQGVYFLRGLPVGVYSLTATLGGFKKFETKDIRLQVNEVVRVDVSLAVGETAETVTVVGDVVHVDTTTATLRTVVDQRRIEDLPLNGRNPTQLMRLVAGVQLDQRTDVTSGTTYPGVQAVSVNGGRGNATNYVLDGAQNNDHYNNAPNPMPNPDALQEFSVQTNNFSAEFGRQAAGLVNAVTKSGTNDFHGAAFEYLRNKSVNAANFFSPIQNGKKLDDGLKRNQYGLTLGGPFEIPKVYHGKDKSFFFFSYQGQRLRRTPSSVSRIVPTAAQKAGDFSSLLPRQTLRNPFGGGVYPNNQIPLSQYNPAAKFIADNFLPVPAGGNTISFPTVSNYDDDQVLLRGDHQITSRNRLSARYWRSWAEQPGALDPKNYLTAVGARKWLNYSTTANDTHVFSATLINNFLFGYNHTNGPVLPIYPEKSLTALGVKMYNDDKPQYHLTVNGYFQINTGDTNDFFRDEYQFNDTVRWSRGKHQISLGGEYGRGLGDVVNNFRANGQFGWNGSAPFTGDALADYFVGKFATLSQGIGEYKNTRFQIFALFLQDSMKLTRRLTLDLGVRWDPFFPYTDELGKLSAWRPGQRSTRYPNAPLGVLYPGDPGLPDGGYNTAWNNLGPRAGFAYDVFGDGKTSIRGGYGIFYDRMNTLQTNQAATQGPFGTIANINGNAVNSFSDPYAGDVNPFPAPLNPPRDVKFVLPHTAFLYEEHMRNGNIQGWNLTLEREVASGFLARVAYAGSKGTRLFSGRELDPAIYSPGATTATTNQRRPLAPLGYGSVILVEPVGNSTFHSLQLTGERRFSKGFSLLANYMWSKSIDDGSSNKGNGISHTDPFNTHFDKGPADYDHTQVFTLSGLWQLPVRFESHTLNRVFGGWNLTGITTLMSGPTFTVGSGADNARSGTGGQRADLIGNPYFSGNRSRGEIITQYLNKAAFGPNALGTFGNLGRNRFRAPGLANVDLGLHKNFRITERVSTQFRFETFNTFNRVNLNLPETNLASGNFVRVTSAGDPRILQFALRLQW